MIRINGTDSKTGQRTVLIILGPDQIRQLRAGTPIAVDLQRGHPDIVTAPMELVIEAPRAFKARLKTIERAAAAQGLTGTMVSKRPRRQM